MVLIIIAFIQVKLRCANGILCSGWLLAVRNLVRLSEIKTKWLHYQKTMQKL